MIPSLPSAATSLRKALEELADSMCSAAQMASVGLAESGASAEAQHDMLMVLDTTRTVYQLVHKELVARHFNALKIPATAEIQRIRHDLRGLLQNILLRCELVSEESTLTKATQDELADIRRYALDGVAALNTSRDLDEDEDVSSHLLGSQDAPMEFVPHSPALVSAARILVADDSAQSRELLGRFLTRQGHSVAYVATGRETLQAAQSEEFDLILLDLVMPELNGFEVLQALRRLGILNHTPVILISGMDTEGNAIRGIELGADDFLPRPVDLKLLQARVNSSLERQRLRERELAQYFTPRLARHLLRHPEVLATGRSTEVTVLFCDIVGFSQVSERLGPEATIRWVGEVLGAMSACIMAEDGVLVDYTGDQVMALWGAPHDQADHADRACKCAAAMMQALPQLNEKWQAAIGQSTAVTIGINTGEAFVGNIGTPQKFKFGALGNTVNLASRVQSASKFVRASVLLTANTHRRLQGKVKARRLGSVRVNNIAAAVGLYELPVQNSDKLTADYECALEKYESGDMRAASALLGVVLKEFPHDGPSLLLMSRAVQEMLRDGTTPFDPVWSLPGK